MTRRENEVSPQAWARIGGVLYLIVIAAGVGGELLVRDRLIVPGDATATSENIRSFELLWRLAIAANLFHLACAVALGLVFYVLLRRVDRDLALLAVLFNIVCIAIEAVSKLFLLPSLFVLGKAAYLQAFTPEQLHALAYLSNRSHTVGFNVSLIFFGCECLVLGYLIFRSRFLPTGARRPDAGRRRGLSDEQLRGAAGTRSGEHRLAPPGLRRGAVARPLAARQGRRRSGSGMPTRPILQPATEGPRPSPSPRARGAHNPLEPAATGDAAWPSDVSKARSRW